MAGVAKKKGYTSTGISLDYALARGKVGLGPEDRALILATDEGIAEAQCELGLLLISLGHPERAVRWLEKAVDQRVADAMQWLGWNLFQTANQHLINRRTIDFNPTTVTV